MTMSSHGSLRHRLILLSIGVLALYYVLVSLFSIVFMEPYYLHKVEQSLVDAYSTIRKEGEINLTTISQLEEGNLSFVIADRETLDVVYNSQMSDKFLNDMVAHMLPFIRDYAGATDTGYNINADEMYQHTTAGATVSKERRVTLGGVTKEYVLDISTSYASIAQATTISVQFSLIVGLLVMIIAVVAFSRMATMVTKPVTQITSIANQIAHLDFSQKCQSDLGGEILSCDVHGGKLPQIELAAERLGVSIVKTMENDASVFRPEWENAFDAVTADVPCSGLGVIRKKPDIRYKNLSDLEQLPILQRKILEQAGRYVRPGGMLLYSTCTILKRENEDVALDFLSAHGEFSPETLHLPQPLEESRTGMLTLYQGIHQCDGFFMCKMRKQL